MGRLYVMKHFNNYSKQAVCELYSFFLRTKWFILKATEMIENIRVEFMQILRETEWLDEQSRELALAKVIRMAGWIQIK